MIEMLITAIIALVVYLLGLAQGWTMTREEWRKSILLFSEGFERDMCDLRAEIICLRKMNPDIPSRMLFDECIIQRKIRHEKAKSK